MDKPLESVLYSARGDTDSYGKSFIRHTTTLEMFQKTFCDCIDSLSPQPGETITIGDYGAATGTRTMQLFKDVIGFIRKRHERNRQVMFVYNDLPSNDFNGLFQRLAGYIPGPETYLRCSDGVFCLATGKSLYQQVMPQNSMDIVFSSYALQYLSRRPCHVRNGLMVMTHGTETERQEFKKVAEDDWKNFIFHRAIELKPEGCKADDKFIVLTDALKELLKDDVISETEYVAATFTVYERTEEEIRMPFSKQLECTRELELLSIEKMPVVFLKYRKEHEDEYSWHQFKQDFVDGSVALVHSSIYGALSDDRTVQSKMDVMERYRNEMFKCLETKMVDSFKFGSAAILIRKKQTERLPL